MDGLLKQEIEAQIEAELEVGKRIHKCRCEYCDALFHGKGMIEWEVVRHALDAGQLASEEPPFRWYPSRPRCRRCETFAIRTGTIGIEEALVRIEVEVHGQTLVPTNPYVEVLDYSAADDGYAPPPLEAVPRDEPTDISDHVIQAMSEDEAARWLRIEVKLDALKRRPMSAYGPPTRKPAFLRNLERASDLPPSVARKLESATEKPTLETKIRRRLVRLMGYHLSPPVLEYSAEPIRKLE
ncbi:hypothetical protein [Halomarina rubra]|uniref:C2H2-type domain-containing protein n=1 Tax=Halomarina rubra TaxID=2071873 RepID=A0ABD6AWB4_9EURY|nr:hypothetical protein [Halomarina rubra]